MRECYHLLVIIAVVVIKRKGIGFFGRVILCRVLTKLAARDAYIGEERVLSGSSLQIDVKGGRVETESIRRNLEDTLAWTLLWSFVC